MVLNHARLPVPPLRHSYRFLIIPDSVLNQINFIFSYLEYSIRAYILMYMGVFSGKENNFKFCPMCAGPLRPVVLDGRERMACAGCGWIAFLNPPPVVCAVCYSPEGMVALIKRGVEPKKGAWCLPGGFMELGESPVEACLRELKEEAGIDSVGRIEIISAEYQESRRYGSVVVIGYAVESLDPDELCPGDDAEDAAWFYPMDIEAMPFESFQRIFELWLERYFPY